MSNRLLTGNERSMKFCILLTLSTVISNYESTNINSLKEKELRKKSLNRSAKIQQSLMLTERYSDNFKGMSIKKRIKINMIAIDIE